MISTLPESAMTQRAWNGRDDIFQHYMGRVPQTERIVTLTLTWKRNKNSRSEPVGRFRFDMDKLVEAGYVRKVPGWYILRFQRTGNRIEVATNRSERALPLPPVLHDYVA
jgi:hypothetical protein